MNAIEDYEHERVDEFGLTKTDRRITSGYLSQWGAYVRSGNNPGLDVKTQSIFRDVGGQDDSVRPLPDKTLEFISSLYGSLAALPGDDNEKTFLFVCYRYAKDKKKPKILTELSWEDRHYRRFRGLALKYFYERF